MDTSLITETICRAADKLPLLFYSGRVSRVVGLVIEGYLPKVPVGASCRIHLQNSESILAEVIGLKGEHAVLMPIGSTVGIKVGDLIEPLRDESVVKVSPQLIGRIVDGCGEPMDGGPAIIGEKEYSLYSPAVSAVSRKLMSKTLSLGVRAIDGFLTCAIGQRMAIMAGSGVGKSTLMGMIARNARADVNVIGLIGERGREVMEFLENDLGREGLKRSVLVVATSDQPPLIRMRAAFTATTIAEYFRDQGKNVLLMMDSLTRFAMASREVGLSLGEPPTVKGYTPSLFSTLPKLLERAGTTDREGSITGLYTILTESDDLQDPIADAVRAIVDGHIVLSRKLATMGHYPPIDILQSISRVMKNVIPPENYSQMSRVRRALSLYEDMADYIRMGVYASGKDPELDKAIGVIDDIKTFLNQTVAEKTSLEESRTWLSKIAMNLGNY